MTTVTITVNDEARTLAQGATCRTLVEELTGRTIRDDGRPTEGAGLGIAVALDGNLVPRTHWNTTTLRDGHAVEVVTAVQGG